MRNLSEGLAKTFELLGRTENKTALRVLVTALDSENARIAKDALLAIIKRPGQLGKTEILGRLDDIPPSWKRILEENSSHLSGTLRDSILGRNESLFDSATRAVVWLRQYELVPALLNVLEEANDKQAESVGKTLLELVQSLYAELSGAGRPSNHRDPKLMRAHVVEGLERSVKRFSIHRRREVLEAFLLLARPDNKTLREVLNNPHHAAFLVAVDILSRNPHGGVMRLLLGFLDDPHPPPAALSTISKRSDLTFVSHFLHKIGRPPSRPAVRNIKRIRSVAWLEDFEELLEHLDDKAHCGAIGLVMQSGIPRLKSFGMVKSVLFKGKPAGRRAAAKALAEFPGTEANTAAMKALEDSDPEVQANIIGHIRRRGTPRVLGVLVKMVESSSELVRDAARAELPEFTFERFAASFDMLDDEVRISSGALVRKIDPRTAALLREEMRSPMHSRRIRSIAIAEAMGMVNLLEDALIELASDTDHLVRLDAVNALAQCSGWMSRQVLENSLSDRSVPVRDSARRALFQRDLQDLSISGSGPLHPDGPPSPPQTSPPQTSPPQTSPPQTSPPSGK